MNKHIEVTNSSEQADIEVRRRNENGIETKPVSITLSKHLRQTINGIVVKSGKTRSLVISELIEKGLQK